MNETFFRGKLKHSENYFWNNPKMAQNVGVSIDMENDREFFSLVFGVSNFWNLIYRHQSNKLKEIVKEFGEPYQNNYGQNYWLIFETEAENDGIFILETAERILIYNIGRPLQILRYLRILLEPIAEEIKQSIRDNWDRKLRIYKHINYSNKHKGIYCTGFPECHCGLDEIEKQIGEKHE